MTPRNSSQRVTIFSDATASTVNGSFYSLFLILRFLFDYGKALSNCTCIIIVYPKIISVFVDHRVGRLLKLTGCLPSSVMIPLMISFPILDVYPAGQTVTLSCAAGFTLSGSATAMCSGTTFMFDDLTATCLSS